LTWYWAFFISEWAIRIGLTFHLLKKRTLPSNKLAWLCVIYVIPYLGLVLYLMLGGGRLSRRRAKKIRKAQQVSPANVWRNRREAVLTQPPMDDFAKNMMRQAEHVGGMFAVAGNSIDFLSDTQSMVDRLIKDIDHSRHHCHLLFYIFQPDVMGQLVASALMRASSRGVECRLLVDDAGSWAFVRNSALIHELRAAGVQVVPALEVSYIRRGLERLDMRNHRKLAIIDGEIAYAGSQNIVEPDFGHRRAGAWVDLTGRFTGPVVGQMQSVFNHDWTYETEEQLLTEKYFPQPTFTGEVVAQSVPTGPSYDTGDFHRVLLTGINSAQRRIIITSPYLVPDESTMIALSMASDRGVNVWLVLPKMSDHWVVSAAGKAYYAPLLESGVRIFLYQPGLLHAKTVTIDDSMALLGSSNLDVRSFYLNFELSILMYGGNITSQLRQAQQSYINQSVEIDLKRWLKRPAWRTYGDQAMALLSPLL
jgi:cardiolipin synthase A/B